MGVIKLSVAATSSNNVFTFIDAASIGWSVICLVIIIYGIVAVEKHRPSYLLPYIGTMIFTLIFLVCATVLVWVGPREVRDHIIVLVLSRAGGFGRSYEDYHDIVVRANITLILSSVLQYYFYSVVHSYYKQMQEEDKGIYNPRPGTGGVIYAAPAVQTQGYDQPPAYGQQPVATAYPQQSAAAPYPAQNVGYPQPAAGYPYLPQNAGYPQQQLSDYPVKQ